jgi:hypothetical protein
MWGKSSKIGIKIREIIFSQKIRVLSYTATIAETSVVTRKWMKKDTYQGRQILKGQQRETVIFRVEI